MHLSFIFASISLALFIYGSVPYVLSVKRGDTNPQRVSVYIFLILTALSVLTQFAEGATLSLVLPAFGFCLNIAVITFMKKSDIGKIRAIDKFSFVAAIAILGLWAVTNSAALAIILLVLVNIIAKVLITKKVYNYPHSEPVKSYVFWILGSIFTVISVGSLDWILLLPAFNNIVTLVIIVAVMMLSRKKTAFV